MTHFFSNKAFIFTALGVLVALGVWWGISRSEPSNSLIKTENAVLNPAERSLVDTLLQLRAVSLNGAIFSDPGFMILRDFGTQIIPEPVGRPNPFAPASRGGATSSSPLP